MTPKQERFVTEYLKDLNATQAAVRAGYSERTAGQIGAENLKKPEIAAAVAIARQQVNERNELTVDSHLERLATLSEKAETEKQFSAAIAAEVNRGKVAGFYVERTEDVTNLTPKQREDRIVELLQNARARQRAD